MRLYGLVFLIFVFLCGGAAASDGKQEADKEEEEIIKILDLLENYDLLINMDAYGDTDKTGGIRDTAPDSGENDKKGNQ
jgi:hypothetical protein